MSTPLLVAEGLTKRFGSVVVLDHVGIDVYPGEVHAVVGENGAGKSTLGKIISGVYKADGGSIILDGERHLFASPAEAQEQGVVMIYQEPTLFPDLDVAENILIGQRPLAGAVPLIRRRAMRARAQELLSSIGAHTDVRATIAQLSVADQQLVEIAAALARNARVVIMDEPTASLTPHEVNNFFDVVQRLKASGVGMIFVSHRLEEIFAIADRITVLRDGEHIVTLPVNETSRDEVIKFMVGRELSSVFVKDAVAPGDTVLEARNLSRRGYFSDISFTVRRGEILGLAGLVGAGRSEVVRSIFGIDPVDAGEVLVEGTPVRIRSPRDALGLGLALVPEDRQHQGLILTQPIDHNMTLTILREITTAGWIKRRKERSVARTLASRLQLRAQNLMQPVGQLSGGNQQKVVLAKWLVTHPKILILDEPTRGIDVGAKAEVYRFMSELTAQGVAILMISSELPEVMGMSDRIAVMREGRITAFFDRDKATPELVMTAATGEKVAMAGVFE